MEDTGLDAILGGEQPAEPEVAEQPEPTEPDAKGDDAAETPAAQEKPDQTVPLAALLAERDKRQALEQELRAREEQTPRPTFAEDPEAWRDDVEKRVAERVENERVNMSMALAKSVHADFDDAMKAWEDVCNQNPAAYQTAVQSANPGETAYRMCRQHLTVKEVGDDPAAYREKLKAEILAELKGSETKPQVALPSSLAAVPNTAGRTEAPDNGPTPLDQILPKT